MLYYQLSHSRRLYMLTLSNGVQIPMIGLGVFKTQDGEETQNAVKWALEGGYRHIDTAKVYRNEESVGAAVAASDVPREDIFITTKLWNQDLRAGRYREAFEESLAALKTDYIDLYLIHWPVEGFEKAWPVIEELYREKKIRAIGVSNFHKHHLEALEKVATIKPMINQIESHPMMNNQELIDYCQQQGIAVEAWSPLGGNGTQLVLDETLVGIGQKYNKSAAQVIIRWNIQRNVVVLPKSANEGRIKSNIDVFDFELSEEDMAAINHMNQNKRVGSDPDNFNF